MYIRFLGYNKDQLEFKDEEALLLTKWNIIQICIACNVPDTVKFVRPPYVYRNMLNKRSPNGWNIFEEVCTKKYGCRLSSFENDTWKGLTEYLLLARLIYEICTRLSYSYGKDHIFYYSYILACNGLKIVQTPIFDINDFRKYYDYMDARDIDKFDMLKEFKFEFTGIKKTERVQFVHKEDTFIREAATKDVWGWPSGTISKDMVIALAASPRVTGKVLPVKLVNHIHNIKDPEDKILEVCRLLMLGPKTRRAEDAKEALINVWENMEKYNK